MPAAAKSKPAPPVFPRPANDNQQSPGRLLAVWLLPLIGIIAVVAIVWRALG